MKLTKNALTMLSNAYRAVFWRERENHLSRQRDRVYNLSLGGGYRYKLPVLVALFSLVGLCGAANAEEPANPFVNSGNGASLTEETDDLILSDSGSGEYHGPDFYYALHGEEDSLNSISGTIAPEFDQKQKSFVLDNEATLTVSGDITLTVNSSLAERGDFFRRASSGTLFYVDDGSKLEVQGNVDIDATYTASNVDNHDKVVNNLFYTDDASILDVQGTVNIDSIYDAATTAVHDTQFVNNFFYADEVSTIELQDDVAIISTYNVSGSTGFNSFEDNFFYADSGSTISQGGDVEVSSIYNVSGSTGVNSFEENVFYADSGSTISQGGNVEVASIYNVSGSGENWFENDVYYADDESKIVSQGDVTITSTYNLSGSTGHNSFVNDVFYADDKSDISVQGNVAVSSNINASGSTADNRFVNDVIYVDDGSSIDLGGNVTISSTYDASSSSGDSWFESDVFYADDGSKIVSQGDVAITSNIKASGSTANNRFDNDVIYADDGSSIDLGGNVTISSTYDASSSSGNNWLESDVFYADDGSSIDLGGNVTITSTYDVSSSSGDNWLDSDIFYADDGSHIVSQGDVTVRVTYDASGSSGSNLGISNVFYADAGSSIDLDGNVDVISTINVSGSTATNRLQSNVFLAEDGSTINIGSSGTTTKAWAIAKDADLISALDGSTVKIKSTNNQLVGSIDLLDLPEWPLWWSLHPDNSDEAFKVDTVSATFSGEDSYWFGDDQSYMNADGDGRLGNLLVDLADNDTLDLIFTDGAQWSYLGFTDTVSLKGTDKVVAETISKRISSITLLDGGIINIDDDDLKETWEEEGILDAFAEAGIDLDGDWVEHDYVRIGSLKGTGGIFRLDLDFENHANSDMIFIEGGDGDESTSGGVFYIDADASDLASLSLSELNLESPLRFATVSSDAGITFANSKIYGSTLYDYTLVVASEAFDKDAADNSDYLDRLKEEGVDDKYLCDFLMKDEVAKENWVITNIQVSESSSARSMSDAGFATYSAITMLDSAASRNREMTRYAVSRNIGGNIGSNGGGNSGGNGEGNGGAATASYADHSEGLWVRVNYGQHSYKSHFSGDYLKATVGFDHFVTDSNRLGIGLTYHYGDVDFDNVDGSSELSGYEAMIYDTQYFGDQYLDFVLRLGSIKNEFESINEVGANYLDSDYDQKYAALSAEYGICFSTDDGAFLEPQLQAQVAYLAESDYEVNGMTSEIEDAFSIIGRVGLRGGKAWLLDNGYTNELYAHVSLLHDFTDGQDARYSDGINSLETTWGNRSTWCEFGVGTSLHFDTGVALSFDLSKAVGNEIDDTWEVSGQVRYIF